MLLGACGVIGLAVFGIATLSGDDGDAGVDAGSSTGSPVGAVAPGAGVPATTIPPGPAEPTAINQGFQADVLYVALYGKIGSGSLGVLGEQGVDEAVTRAALVAAPYRGFAETVVPAFELIASVASYESGDGDYSNEASIPELRPWVDAADENEMSVILDLQSGRESFSSQIEQFEELLLEPHVNVALDPEWRVPSDDVPEGGRVGSVTAAEVNETVDYLAGLVVEHDLPRKMLIVHQFRDDMILNRSEIVESPYVQIVIQMDGFGPLTLKHDTYAMVASNLPDGLLTGWKNFYDEDAPTPTPAQTMEVVPRPVYVSFQ